ncbi:hypothetical protein HOD75_00715 [archaeon]|jgi:hypothetical protein|nr:hypothetical protein [archaeon]MBT4241398.1 hypothetical protein [archaeon]MBT4418219.1 hypothetical protein [archaeon]
MENQERRKYLFMCLVGQNRSPTAARVARDLVDSINADEDDARNLDISMHYNGICLVRKREDKMDYLAGFERYFVMMEEMRDELVDLGIDRKKIECLYLDDIYGREDKDLVRRLEASLKVCFLDVK